MEVKKIACLIFVFTSVSLLIPDAYCQDISNGKVDGESRTTEIIKHETQPEFVSEIEAEVTTISDFSKESYSIKVLGFTKENAPWKLSSFDISKKDLQMNLKNYSAIYDDVKNDFTSDVLYYESKNKALFCKSNDSVTPMYFGAISIKGNEVELFHKIDGCPTCAKNVKYSRSISNNTLTIKIQEEDGDKSDVFYVLTFNK